jgi:ATP-dependent Clp protease ATP-binding subunit ClpC
MSHHKTAKPPTHATTEPSPLQARLDALLEELQGLRYEEDDDRFEDIVAEIVNFGERLRERLAVMPRSLAYQERRAAVLALSRLGWPERVTATLDLLRDGNWKVRHSALTAVLQAPFPEAWDGATRAAQDPRWEVRRAAVEALGALRRPESAPTLERALRDTDWKVRQSAANATSTLGQARSIEPLLETLDDDDEDVRNAVVAALLQITKAWPHEDLRAALEEVDGVTRRGALVALEKRGAPGPLGPLLRALKTFVAEQVDTAELARFGRVLTHPEELAELERAFEADKNVEALLRALDRPGNRSTLVVGEAGVGKTALIHEVIRRLSEREPDCVVLETSTSELMVGTKYIGEWETKLHDLVEKIKAPRKIILYLTNVNDLPGAGTTSSNKQNFVTLLGPYMRRGEVTVLGETSGEAMRQGLEKDLSIKRLFQVVPLDAPDAATVTRILERTLGEQSAKTKVRLSMGGEVMAQLVELSNTYAQAVSQPGRSVGLLKQVVDRALEGLSPRPASLRLTPQDVILGLARTTGLPEALLNDQTKLDPQEVRRFFGARVLGQPEAQDAVVDLITTIKAGLNDPSKPFGVFLFVGPTGVGKTELAKALAEFVFGSEQRLVRLDLSEFRDYESFERLIGGTARHPDGLLSSKVRERPFSVVLLDEIEKAHPNVFDLLLQVFDAGRLSDAQGRTTDFRHAVLIMTSNLASAIPPGGALGFGDDEGLASAAGVLREVQRFFRPEFINRVDRLVVFRPLSTEAMRGIARRELGKALMRSGVMRRRLVVDVEPAVLERLLAQGFSKAFGARPLKRTIEQQVVLPLARQIVERAPSEGLDALRVHVGAHGQVEVEAHQSQWQRQQAQRELDLRALEPEALLQGGPLASLLDRPRARAAALAQHAQALAALRALEPRCDGLRAQRDRLERALPDVTFWDDPHHARRHLEALAAIQRLLADHEQLRDEFPDLAPPAGAPSKAQHAQRLRWAARLAQWSLDHASLQAHLPLSSHAPPRSAP